MGELKGHCPGLWKNNSALVAAGIMPAAGGGIHRYQQRIGAGACHHAGADPDQPLHFHPTPLGASSVFRFTSRSSRPVVTSFRC